MKNVKQIAITLLTGVVLLGGSCVKDSGGGAKREESKDIFDFSTKKNYTLNLDYDVPVGYKVYFEVYTENPMITNQENQRVLKAGLEPIDKGYTDAKGTYSDQLTMPSYIKNVYVYSPNAGVEPLMVAKVENGVLSTPAIPRPVVAPSTQGATRAGNIVSTVDIPGVNTHLLGTWEHYINGYAQFPDVSSSILYDGQAKIWGRPNYMKYVDQSFYPNTGESTKSISADVWKTINSVLPGDDVAPEHIDVLESGDIKVSKDAEVDIVLLDDRGAYQNVLTYYCYDTANPPTSSSDVKYQVIALPSTKILKSRDTAFPGTGVTDYGALRPGEGVRLKYVDQNGVDHGTKFPAGVSIGWILYSNGYRRTTGVVGAGEGAIYSDPTLSSNREHVALFRHGSDVVLSFEDVVKTSDTSKRDYDDVMFSVIATPMDAITPGIPDKEPEPEAPPVEVTYRGILLFEDIWPYRGDFDMNDVVVKYISKVRQNTNNQIIETIDQYTILHSGAKHNNSFAYLNPNLGAGATVSFEGGDSQAAVDVNNKTIIRLANNVLDYANLATKKTFMVTTKYSTPMSKRDFTLPPYNPFITVNKTISHEVHLTNMRPTSYADMSTLGTGHDFSNAKKEKFYITFNENGEQMPFGIDIMFDNQQAQDAFVITKENKNINTHYYGFMPWLLSGGTTDQDWYLHPNK